MVLTLTRVAAGAAVAAGITFLGGCGDVGSATPSMRISMTEHAFLPDPIVTDIGGGRLVVVNDGQLPHDLVIPELGRGTADLAPGTEADLDLTGDKGTFVVICSLPGHREAGMETTITIQ